MYNLNMFQKFTVDLLFNIHISTVTILKTVVILQSMSPTY